MRRSIVAGLVLAAVLVGMAGGALATHRFSDVPDDHVHAPGIDWASGRRIFQGYADGTFRPDQPVTRGQLATVLHRQGAHTGPVYTLTSDCGSTMMIVAEHNQRGSSAATVSYSVNGGDRHILPQIPAEGFISFDAAESGVVTLFVDSIAWASTPTGETCTQPVGP